MKPRSGFTLVELAIVLVIIGLIIGGILVGRDMIRGAEIKAQIRQIDGYVAAVHTFKNKYNCIPGDCANATQFGLGPLGTASDNGNGDGAIGNRNFTFNIASAQFSGGWPSEALNFWYHLSRAGLISGSFAGYTLQNDFTDAGVPDQTMPKAKINESFAYVIPSGFSSRSYNTCSDPAGCAEGRNGFAIGGISGPVGSGLFQEAVSSVDSSLIDAKYDDGLPQTGSIRCSTYGDRRQIGAAVTGGFGCIYQSWPNNLCSVWGGVNAYFQGGNGSCALDFINKF